MAIAALPCAVAANTANTQREAATDGNAQAAPAPEIMTKLSTYMSEAGDRALPDYVMEKTKEHTLDTIASMISGVDLPPAQIALRFAREQAGQQQVATIVGTELLCGPLEAALANGMMAHSDETDDSHAPSHSHPGCAIVAAALAAGERFGVSGMRFLRSITLGYDIGPRVLLTLGGLPFQMTTHRSAHCIANTFGASAAAGCAAQFTAQQMRWLLDYAAQQASGIAAWQRDTQHIEKSFVFAGSTARNGVTAALLIHLGATGVDDIFSGADNFLLTFAPNADPEKLIDKLGERYEVTRTNIKKWTVGSPIQAPLDAIEDLMKQHPFTPDQVESVIVRVATSEAKTVNDRNMPDISLQHMTAVMIVDKTVTFRSAHDKSRMQNPAVLAIKQKVKLVPDEALEKLYPKRVTITEVNLKDGSHLTQRVEAVRGTAENPMSRQEVITKARDLMEPYLGTEQTAKLIEAVFNIEAVK
ncbi:MAG TPA: MmgE/PrpD family protein, partial [Terriglobales bacterium]